MSSMDIDIIVPLFQTSCIPLFDNIRLSNVFGLNIVKNLDQIMKYEWF